MILIKIPLSYNNLDKFTIQNYELLIQLYIQNQFVTPGLYEIIEVQFELTEHIILSATIKPLCEFIPRKFCLSPKKKYSPPEHLALIKLQQNGIGFADPTRLKAFKKKQNRKTHTSDI
jgi:hypothetical protein